MGLKLSPDTRMWTYLVLSNGEIQVHRIPHVHIFARIFKNYFLYLKLQRTCYRLHTVQLQQILQISSFWCLKFKLSTCLMNKNINDKWCTLMVYS